MDPSFSFYDQISRFKLISIIYLLNNLTNVYASEFASKPKLFWDYSLIM